jgi:hypothetical protein
VFGLCDEYVTRQAALDPVAAGMRGITEAFSAATDYGPDGVTARAELISVTLTELGTLPVTSEADRLAAGYLRERLEAQLAWHQLGEPRPGFDLKRWHTAALNLGPIGLDDLAEALARV